MSHQFLTLIRNGEEFFDPQIEPDQAAVEQRASSVHTATDGRFSILSVPLSAVIAAGAEVAPRGKA